MFILLTLCLLPFQSLQLNISSIFSPSVALNSYTYTITSNQKYIHAILIKSYVSAPTLLIMKTTPFIPSTNRNDWLDVNPFLTTQYDYEGLVTGRNQYVWLLNPGIGLTVYFQIINFQSFTSSGYTISVTESNIWLYSCLPYQTYRLTNYCLNCPATLEGVFCTIASHPLSANSPIEIKMAAGLYYSFFIASQSSSISIKIKVRNGGIMTYLQEVKYSNEHAGIVNYLAQDNSNNIAGISAISQNKEQNFNNIASGNAISIGIINTNTNSSQNVVIAFSISEGINTLVIVIGIVGGILLLALIIAVIILVRKYRDDASVFPEILRP